MEEKGQSGAARTAGNVCVCVCAERVCLSASAFMGCETLPCCERVHAVHASPAGEICSCKLMLHIYKYMCVHSLSWSLCEVQAGAHGCVSKKPTDAVMNVNLCVVKPILSMC